MADIAGKPRTPFHYKDKGFMAMIGDGAAVAEMGAHHHELHGHMAFAAWLGVHAWLMSGVHQRADAFLSWGWDYVGSAGRARCSTIPTERRSTGVTRTTTRRRQAHRGGGGRTSGRTSRCQGERGGS